MQRDQLGDASRARAAFDLDRDAIGDPQPVGRRILGVRDPDAAAQPRTGRHRGEIADTVCPVVQGALQPADARDRANELRRQCEREEAVSDGPVGRQFALGALDVDVDPLVVARRVGKPIDLLLRDLHPFAYADLAANGRLEIVEIVENAHLCYSIVENARTRARHRSRFRRRVP